MGDNYLTYGRVPPMFHSKSRKIFGKKRLRIENVINKVYSHSKSICYENENLETVFLPKCTSG